MSNEWLVVLLPLLAGLAMPLGAWFARQERHRMDPADLPLGGVSR